MKCCPLSVALALGVAALAACSSPPATTTSTAPSVPVASDGRGISGPAAVAPPITPAQAGIDPAWMDASADPCSDFFQYACGGFVKSAVIPPDRATWSVIAQVEKEAEELLRTILEQAAADAGGDPVKQAIGDFYAACMDEAAIARAGLEPIRPLLDAVASVKDARSLTAAVMTLHDASIFVLFSVQKVRDAKDATQVIAGLDQAGLGLPDRDYYVVDDGRKEVREWYRGHVGRLLDLTGMPRKESAAAVADVMRIETALAKMQQTEVERRDPYRIYNRVERAGLKQVAGSFPWDAYFTAIGLPAVDAITVNDPKYFGGVAAMLGKEKPAAWRHYLLFHVLSETAATLGTAFENEGFALEQRLYGIKELPPRWKRCVRATDQALGELLGQPYVAQRFSAEAKRDAEQMVQAIIGAMRAELSGLPWMDAATRAAAAVKLEAMSYMVGYPGTWRKYDFAVKRDDYAGNTLAAGRFDQRRRLAQIGKPVDKSEWQMTPPTVNAYYDPSLNQMVLPAGQLQPPFFGATFHPAVNFGATGASTVGHELTHGFDDEGGKFDGQGNLRDWWSKETSAKFGEATQCVVDQYAQYEAVPGVKLNGKLTSGENIADIGGVKLGWAAYLAWRAAQPTAPPAVEGMGDDQLYFLAYAQTWCSKETPELLELMAHTNPHSPPRWRVNGPVADVPAFGEAFRCEVGAPMRPKNVCEVW